MLLKEVMAENRGLTLSDLKNRSPEHLCATLTGCESPDGYLEPAAVKEDADDQLSEIASTIPLVDPSYVDLKHTAFLAQLLLEEVDLESTFEPASPVGKPVLHMQPMHRGEPVAGSADALARPAFDNMPLSEHDTQELRRLLYLKAEGIERQERLQYLRHTWKSSIGYEQDYDSYMLPDPGIPLVYSLHYGQQCSPEWDDGSVPAESADRQKKKEHGKSNLLAQEHFLQKLESLNLRDAGLNSHEFARIRIRPEFAQIRGPLRTRIRNFKFQSSLIHLIESIGTYNLPSRLQFTCLHMGMPLPSTMSHKRFPKSFRNRAIFVVCCCLHLPC